MILILLTILKIIGIILLVLLGLIVLLFCLLLFAPVRYRVKGAKHPDDLFVTAFISYLKPLVRVRVEYPSETVLSVKILWIDLLHPKEKKNHKSRIKKEKRGESGKKETTEIETAGAPKQESSTAKPMRAVEETPFYQVDMLPDDYKAKDRQVESEGNETKAGTETIHHGSEYETGKEAERSEQNRDTKIKSGQSAQKRNTDQKTDQSGQKKSDKKSAAKKKTASHAEKNTENKLAAIATLLWQYKEMYPDVLGRVFHALKSILPRKCDIHLIFGTGSPDNTGYLYGAYCALQEYLPGTIVFEPVWMESYLDVEFELSGNIRLIHFVTAAVKIIADKRVRKFIAEIRRL